MSPSTFLAGRGSRVARLVTLSLAAALALAGCSGSSPGGSASVPTDPSQVKGDLNIVVSSAAGSDAGFKAVNDAFTAKYPNVKVNFSAVPNENYNQTRTSRLTAGSIDLVVANPRELPSYVPASNEGDDARLADAGGWVDLTSQPFMSKFTPTVLDQIKYKGKSYTVPTGLSYYSGLTYNKKIFADNNLQVPTTWDEFIKVCDALKLIKERNRYVRGLISWLGFRQTGVEYVRDKRFAGETKYPLKKMLRFAFDAITSFSFKQLKLSSYVGLPSPWAGSPISWWSST